jgi:NTE family protein
MKIGLVLSGGAVRGAAHIGILKALEEENIPIYAVSGVSAGAIVGSFYCFGYSAKDIEKIALEANFLKMFSPSIPFKSLFSLYNLEKFLKNYIKENKIEKLQKKFFITTTNLNEGTYVFWDRGNLYEIVRASSSIPFIFEPVEIEGNKHVDGGLLNNLPVEPLKEICDYTIAVDVSPLSKEQNINNIFNIAIRSFYLAIRSNIEVRKNIADIFIQPEELININIFDIRKIKDAIEIGYKEGKKLAEAVKPLL